MTHISDPNVGLVTFKNFYTQNTGVSNACNAPRTQSIVNKAKLNSGLAQLMLDTQKLPCHESVSNAPQTPLYNSIDAEIMRYNVFKGRKERCGCGGVALPLPKF